MSAYIISLNISSVYLVHFHLDKQIHMSNAAGIISSDKVHLHLEINENQIHQQEISS